MAGCYSNALLNCRGAREEVSIDLGDFSSEMVVHLPQLGVSSTLIPDAVRPTNRHHISQYLKALFQEAHTFTVMGSAALR